MYLANRKCKYLVSKYIDIKSINANTFIKIVDIISKIKYYKRDLDKIILFFLKIVDFVYRAFIVDILNFILLLYYKTIVTRFKKSIFIFLINNIFDLLN